MGAWQHGVALWCCFENCAMQEINEYTPGGLKDEIILIEDIIDDDIGNSNRALCDDCNEYYINNQTHP